MEKNAHQKNFSVVKNLPTTPMVESVFQNGGSVIIIWIVEMGKTKSIVVSTLYILLVNIYLSINMVSFDQHILTQISISYSTSPKLSTSRKPRMPVDNPKSDIQR